MTTSERESVDHISYVTQGDDASVDRLCRKTKRMVQESRELLDRINDSLHREKCDLHPLLAARIEDQTDHSPNN